MTRDFSTVGDVYLNYQRHVLPAVRNGWLALTIPDKPNSRHQKYRLTDAGRRILKGGVK